MILFFATLYPVTDCTASQFYRFNPLTCTRKYPYLLTKCSQAHKRGHFLYKLRQKAEIVSSPCCCPFHLKKCLTVTWARARSLMGLQLHLRWTWKMTNFSLNKCLIVFKSMLFRPWSGWWGCLCLNVIKEAMNEVCVSYLGSKKTFRNALRVFLLDQTGPVYRARGGIGSQFHFHILPNQLTSFVTLWLCWGLKEELSEGKQISISSVCFVLLIGSTRLWR